MPARGRLRDRGGGVLPRPAPRQLLSGSGLVAASRVIPRRRRNPLCLALVPGSCRLCPWGLAGNTFFFSRRFETMERFRDTSLRTVGAASKQPLPIRFPHGFPIFRS